MATIRYLGHAAFEIKLIGLDEKEKTVLIDPWITNPLSPYKSVDEYLKTVEKIDYIMVTHDHGDHLGDTESIAKKTKAKVIAIYDLAVKLEGKKVKAVGANVGGRLAIPDLFVVLTPAIHSAEAGNPVGVVVGGKDVRVYHAGDTGLFAEMEYIGELYKPDIALLPIGGHFTMGVIEAVKAVELIKPKIVIPMHYNTFPVIKADAEEFKKKVEEKTPAKVVILKPGQELNYP